MAIFGQLAGKVFYFSYSFFFYSYIYEGTFKKCKCKKMEEVTTMLNSCRVAKHNCKHKVKYSCTLSAKI